MWGIFSHISSTCFSACPGACCCAVACYSSLGPWGSVLSQVIFSLPSRSRGFYCPSPRPWILSFFPSVLLEPRQGALKFQVLCFLNSKMSRWFLLIPLFVMVFYLFHESFYFFIYSRQIGITYWWLL
jgi:hypothetical protein